MNTTPKVAIVQAMGSATSYQVYAGGKLNGRQKKTQVLSTPDTPIIVINRSGRPLKIHVTVEEEDTVPAVIDYDVLVGLFERLAGEDTLDLEVPEALFAATNMEMLQTQLRQYFRSNRDVEIAKIVNAAWDYARRGHMDHVDETVEAMLKMRMTRLLTNLIGKRDRVRHKGWSRRSKVAVKSGTRKDGAK